MYADPDDSTQAPTQETQDWIREVMMHLKRWVIPSHSVHRSPQLPHPTLMMASSYAVDSRLD